MPVLDFFKGAGRGFTADLVGGPMDLATQGANLLIGAGGYLGHKSGLLKTDQLPNLLEPKNVPGTSDWFARGTPLEDNGSDAYTRGRFVPTILGLASGAAARRPTQAKGELNTLLFPTPLVQSRGLTPHGDAKLLRPDNVELAPVKEGVPYRPAVDHFMSGAAADLRFGDIFPALAKKIPEWGNIPYRSQPGVMAKGDKATFSAFPAPEVNLNPAYAGDLDNAIIHETNHLISRATGNPSYGSSPKYFQDPSLKATLSRTAQEMDLKSGAASPIYQNFLKPALADPYAGYRRDFDETVAHALGDWYQRNPGAELNQADLTKLFLAQGQGPKLSGTSTFIGLQDPLMPKILSRFYAPTNHVRQMNVAPQPNPGGLFRPITTQSGAPVGYSLDAQVPGFSIYP